jgi:tetratricopeptide (TPR) repeat protein
MKNILRFFRPGVSACLVLGLSASAALGQSTATGGTEDPFELGASARILGMGDAGVALTGDSGGSLQNPALLATVSQGEILVFHAPLFIDTLYDSLGFVQPISGSSGLALSLSRLGVDNILQTQNNIEAISTFSTQEWEATLGLGTEVVPGLGLGIQMKGIQEQISTYQGEGVGVDAGLVYRFASSRLDYSNLGFSNFDLALSVANMIPPQVTLFQNADNPAEIIRPALGFRYDVSPNGDRIWVTLEGEMTQGGNNIVKAGAEYAFQNTFFARAGFDGISPTAGAGVSLEGLELDYAYNQRDLGSLNRFSLVYRFGEYQDPARAQKLDMLKWVAQNYDKDNDYDAAIKAWSSLQKEFPEDRDAAKAIQSLKERRKQQVANLMKLARPAMQKGDYAKGIPLLGKVLALDPGNIEAQALLKHVDRNIVLESSYLSGVEAYRHEDYKEAADYLRDVYDANPDYRDVTNLLRDAESRYQPLESLPKNLSDLYAKGVEYYMKGQYAQAIEAWQKVLAGAPNNHLIQRNLSEARSHLGDPTPIPHSTEAP